MISSESKVQDIRMNGFKKFVNSSGASWNSFPGAITKELAHYSLPTLLDNYFNIVIIHVGINDPLNSNCKNNKKNW